MALSAAADISVHNEMAYPAVGEGGERKDPSNRSGKEGVTAKNQKLDKAGASQSIVLSPMPYCKRV